MWIFAGILGAAAAALLGRSSYERKHFTVETFQVESDKLKKSERNYVFLSDLHSNTFGRDNERLIEAIDRAKPDGIFIGGDMMVCRKGNRDVEQALKLVLSLAARYPVYYGNGNHENRMDRERKVYGDLYDRYRGRLSRAGVVFLSDCSAMVEEDIRITGLDIAAACYKKFRFPKLSVSRIRKKVGEASGDTFQILLAHSPLFFDAYAAWGADLTLAGHFHGGTIRLPFLGGVMTPQFQFFLPWCGGMFGNDGRRMVVSRGLGTHSINIRINNRPQLVVLSLRNPSLHRD